VYEPVALQQDYRKFDFLSPWEGARAMEQLREKSIMTPDSIESAQSKSE
jgi:hypothetical protein